MFLQHIICMFSQSSHKAGTFLGFNIWYVITGVFSELPQESDVLQVSVRSRRHGSGGAGRAPKTQTQTRRLVLTSYC